MKALQIAQLKFALTSILMETTHEMIENIAKGALEDGIQINFISKSVIQS